MTVKMPLFCCELAKICLVTHRPIEHTQECYQRRTQEAVERAKERIPQQELPLKEEDK